MLAAMTLSFRFHVFFPLGHEKALDITVPGSAKPATPHGGAVQLHRYCLREYYRDGDTITVYRLDGEGERIEEVEPAVELPSSAWSAGSFPGHDGPISLYLEFSRWVDRDLYRVPERIPLDTAADSWGYISRARRWG